jgi:hypothetical protein
MRKILLLFFVFSFFLLYNQLTTVIRGTSSTYSSFCPLNGTVFLVADAIEKKKQCGEATRKHFSIASP